MSEAVEKLGSGREGPVAPRRRWSDAEKRRIVAESYQPGVSVSVVARRNDVNANLVFTWRRQFREQAGGSGGLVRVVVLGKVAGTPQSQLHELLPWNWQDERRHNQAA